MPASAVSPTEISRAIEHAWSEYVARDRHAPTPHPYVYASAWRTCERRMVLEMTTPDQAPPFAPDVLARFRRGDDRERDLLADLSRVGRDAEPAFKVLGQQERFQLKDRKGRIVVSGKVDARLDFRFARPPLECKAWSPQIVDRIDRFEDLFESPWTRSGAHQLLSYLYGAGEPFGFLLLDRSGLPALIPVELEPHLDRVEDFLQRAERAVDHVEAETLPPFLEGDAAECQRCPFYGSTCNPPIAGAGTQILDDPELEAMLERHADLKAAGKEFDALDTKLKKRLRGIESGVAGRFAITGKWGTHTRVEIPDDLKKQYTVKDPKGKFSLEFTRLFEKTSEVM